MRFFLVRYKNIITGYMSQHRVLVRFASATREYIRAVSSEPSLHTYNMYVYISGQLMCSWCKKWLLTLRAPIATKKYRLLFSSAEMFKKPLCQARWTQIIPLQSDLGPPCLLLYLNSSGKLSNYLQQTTSADVIFQMHFFLAL